MQSSHLLILLSLTFFHVESVLYNFSIKTIFFSCLYVHCTLHRCMRRIYSAGSTVYSQLLYSDPVPTTFSTVPPTTIHIQNPEMFLVHPTQILIDGANWAKVSPIHCQISLVHQAPILCRDGEIS